MDLWIRSQTMDILIKSNSLIIDDDTNSIYTNEQIGNNQMTYTLGRYKTKERALEVLDDIERFLIDTNCIVYQMPEE